MNTKKDLLELLRTNWQQAYSVKELSELGYGKPSTIVSRLDALKNVYRVSKGVYQFTPWVRENTVPIKQRVHKLIEDKPNISLSELAKEADVSANSVRKAIQNLRDDGLCITRDSCYKLTE